MPMKTKEEAINSSFEVMSTITTNEMIKYYSHATYKV